MAGGRRLDSYSRLENRRISTDFYLLFEKSRSIACWMRRLRLYKAQLVSSDSIREKLNGGLSKIRQLQSAKGPANFHRFSPAVRRISIDSLLDEPSQVL